MFVSILLCNCPILMSKSNRLLKFYRDPLGVLKRRVISMSEQIRFAAGSDYRTTDYWKYRHELFGFDLRGVGDKTKSHQENVRLLEQGARVLLNSCRKAAVAFDRSTVLDIGCGTGHFTKVLQQNGVTNYLGIDIVDTLFEELRTRFPCYRFQQHDISAKPLEGTYDVILAMDVLQHITDETKFCYALANIKSHLSPSGVVIISTYLGSSRRENFYLVRRPLEVFQTAFAGFTINEPTKYAESFVFSIRHGTAACLH
ncbi:MAG: hypothetical protein A2X67_10620 [Ignavibacteria bacterium GWA2_55_11]|nr:MAG: hypothetical protein A2X67_10620 [Ignavibacteria bacterium GWA2_55_11]OGU43997.1 MAG: hypothetical protein A2X68_02340 [Ignavibacteria bacterium GWC2_56_12]OGU65171.1 MAG: hypothetical protein A3C56_01095 [Ignavibacteria bacterium RIFCSPHIGHO2_02_FULL_56_12]OGU71732.1 MAG: hypothetical protein A3H45_04425 [Ignavibacteria bacterium RIFCSPLOWO2_02_FULL_55_14]OGU73700.1 MAG: hypothetical protein A3G43_01615 [Ignavibacteria bacterium RIFCSPLOWO2_12_FULL_56_21]